jgi:hypothetical protein
MTLGNTDTKRLEARGVVDRVRIDRDALVDVDDHGNRAHREHCGGRRHVAVGGYQDLGAGADAEPDQGGRQPVGAAGSQRAVLHSDVSRVASLEAIALIADAVANQLPRADHRCDRFDLLVADDVHPVPLRRAA